MRAGTCAGIVVALSFLAVGCGDDDADGDDGSGGSQSSCGTAASPDVLTLTAVAPAAGATVPANGVVHTFTIVDTPGTFSQFTFAFDASHTAGTPDPPSFQLLATPEGDDLRFVANPVTWSNAPGTVHLDVQDVYEFPDGCVYAFPSPLFDYQVEPGGGGGGAGGGAGGAGGGAGGGVAGGAGGVGGM